MVPLTSWTDNDAAEFFARLKRSRDNDSKAQYARIQASYLEHSGFLPQAEALLDQILREWPSRFEMASVHFQKATCAARRHDIESALNSLQAALQAERDYPNVRTQAWLEFAKLVALHRRREFYDQVAALVEDRSSEMLFPIDRFYVEASMAMIRDDEGELDQAIGHAESALEATRAETSGFWKHPKLGLANSPDEAFHEAAARIAGRRRDA